MNWYKTSEERHGESGKKGDEGEAFFWDFIEQQDIKYTPLTDKLSQTKRKIDGIVQGVPIDVKTNVFNGFHGVEISTHLKKKSGWIYTTEAIAIVVVDLNNKRIYSYKVEAMKNYIDRHRYRIKQTKTGDEILWVDVQEDFIVTLKS